MEKMKHPRAHSLVLAPFGKTHCASIHCSGFISMMRQIRAPFLIAICLLAIVAIPAVQIGSSAAVPTLSLDDPSCQNVAGLISWWRGEGNALDSTGPNHGTLEGNVTFTPGKVGQAFNFHGWQERVRINSRVYEMYGGTVSLWFNWDGTQASHSANVMIGTSLGLPRVSPVFDIDTGFLLWEFGSLFRNGTNTQVIPGRWYHVAMTYDSNFNVRVYVDGVLKGGGTSANPGEFRNTLVFGNWDTGGPFDVGFGGLMDEVQIYNRPLSDCEVRNLYNTANGSACEVCDHVAPTTSATTSTNANGAGWNYSNVDVLLSSGDDSFGTGVSQITYSASGAQTIAPTAVSGASANFTIAAEGETTITYFAQDNAGNAEAPQTLVVRIDRTAPTIACEAADGLWHSSNVNINCSANDGVSGLASGDDANFSLSTNVLQDTESADVPTGMGQICDLAGNCSTAGPIIGNKIDRKAPTINPTVPANGGVYLLNANIAASYSCSDGGSGVATCAGPVTSGSNIDTTSLGAKSFTLLSTDSVGNTISQTIHYTVRPPVLTVLGPAQIWLGLKNSDDVGTKFDLLAEVFHDSVLIGSGQLNDVPGGSSGFNNAVLRSVDLALATSVGAQAGSTLSVRLSVRIAASSVHSNGTARLWFNDAAANSRFSATIEGNLNDYYLRNVFALTPNVGSGPRNKIDVLVNRNVDGNPFKPLGTWSITF
jgi:hypothetical protein